MVFTLHWSACVYWLIVRIEDPTCVTDKTCDGDSEIIHCNDDISVEACNLWHPPAFIKRDSVGMQYGYSLFWGVSVVMGVGWDIIPTTGLEVAYSSAMIILGTIICTLPPDVFDCSCVSNCHPIRSCLWSCFPGLCLICVFHVCFRHHHPFICDVNCVEFQRSERQKNGTYSLCAWRLHRDYIRIQFMSV